jgi:hypothetical protein
MMAMPVSTLVNAAANEGSELIVPISPPRQEVQSYP